MRRLNCYNISEASFIIAFILFVVFAINGKLLRPAFYTLGVAVAFAIIGVNSKTKLVNHSGKDITIKPEHDDVPVKINKTTEVVRDFDSVKFDGKVYKASDGSNIELLPDGTVKNWSLTGMFINKKRGGFKQTPPDEKWQPLFDAE